MPALDLAHVLGEIQGEQLEAEQAEHLDRALNYAAFLGEILRGSPGRWADRAACKGYTRAMFPEHGQSAEPAYALCQVCPVAAECREWGEQVGGDQVGILAGETFRNRRRSNTDAA